MIHLCLPAYNEEASLGDLLEAVGASLSPLPLPYRVVVVNDGSTDRTEKIARRFMERLPLTIENHPTNLGLGRAVRTGVTLMADMAGADDVLVTMDADNTHDPDLIPSMIEKIQAGADVVIASRFQPGSRCLGLRLDRKLLSTGAGLIFRILRPIKGARDYTSGYRAYRVSVLKKALARYGDRFIESEGFSCMVEILLKLHGLGAVVTEVPMVLRYDLKLGASKMKVGTTVRSTLSLLMKYH